MKFICILIKTLFFILIKLCSLTSMCYLLQQVAAQNCRKRKLDVLTTLEEEVLNLEQQKETLMQERGELTKERAETNDKVQQLYSQLLHTLRDDNGQPYDPNEYSLQVCPLSSH